MIFPIISPLYVQFLFDICCFDPCPGDDGPLLRGRAAGSGSAEAATGRLQCEQLGGWVEGNGAG